MWNGWRWDSGYHIVERIDFLEVSIFSSTLNKNEDNFWRSLTLKMRKVMKRKQWAHNSKIERLSMAQTNETWRKILLYVWVLTGSRQFPPRNWMMYRRPGLGDRQVTTCNDHQIFCSAIPYENDTIPICMAICMLIFRACPGSPSARTDGVTNNLSE